MGLLASHHSGFILQKWWNRKQGERLSEFCPMYFAACIFWPRTLESSWSVSPVQAGPFCILLKDIDPKKQVVNCTSHEVPCANPSSHRLEDCIKIKKHQQAAQNVCKVLQSYIQCRKIKRREGRKGEREENQ